MKTSRYTKTMAEAYDEMYANLDEDLGRSIQNWFSSTFQGGKTRRKSDDKTVYPAYKGGVRGTMEAGKPDTWQSDEDSRREPNPIGSGLEFSDPLDKPTTQARRETAAERDQRRRDVGLEGNAGPERAQQSQRDAQPKIDAANQQRQQGKMGNLPSDYKETEAQAFQDADRFRPGAGTSALPPAVQDSVRDAAGETAPEKPKTVPGEDPMATWARTHTGLARKVKPGQAGYDVIQRTLKDIDGKGTKPQGQNPKVSGYTSDGKPIKTSDVEARNTGKTQGLSTAPAASTPPRAPSPTPAQTSTPKPQVSAATGRKIKPMASTPRLDKATTGIKPFKEDWEKAYDRWLAEADMANMGKNLTPKDMGKQIKPSNMPSAPSGRRTPSGLPLPPKV